MCQVYDWPKQALKIGTMSFQYAANQFSHVWFCNGDGLFIGASYCHVDRILDFSIFRLGTLYSSRPACSLALLA